MYTRAHTHAHMLAYTHTHTHTHAHTLRLILTQTHQIQAVGFASGLWDTCLYVFVLWVIEELVFLGDSLWGLNLFYQLNFIESLPLAQEVLSLEGRSKHIEGRGIRQK